MPLLEQSQDQEAVVLDRLHLEGLWRSGDVLHKENIQKETIASGIMP